MLKLCQVNGNSKSAQLLEFKQETIYGLQDIFFLNVLRNIIFL